MSSLPVLDTPGLPGITRPLDNTALAAYMACPREYYFAMVQHRRHSGLSPALAYGKAMHVALETHYRSGGVEGIVEMMVRQKWEDHDSADDYRTLERVLLDYRRYRERWGADPRSEEGKTLGFPHQPMVEISTNARGAGLIHPYAGKIDRIIEIGGLGYVEDHKTTSRLDKNYYKGFEISQQMMGYVYLARQLVPSLKIVGVRINVIHALKSGTNFERQLFTYSDAQMAEWVSNTNSWMERLSADSLSWERLGQGEFPVGHYGDNGCSRKYGLCTYHPACSISPRLRQQILESQYPVNPWNPLDIDDE